MRKFTLIVAVAALLVPGLALAGGKPTNPGKSQDTTHGKAAPKVMYVLKGTVTAYTNPGSLTLTVTRANRAGKNLTKALNNTSVTLDITAATKVVLHNHAPVANGDKVLVKVRGPKVVANFLAALNAHTLPAFQVVDQGAPKTP